MSTETHPKRKVLFVDDEPYLLEAIKRSLQNKFDIYTAADGKQGLMAMAAHGPFPVIVADLRMPNMGGIEFLQRAREASPDTATIVLTGFADRTSAIESVEKGQVLHFLSKPCSMETLSQAIDAGIRLCDLEAKIVEIRGFLQSVA